MDNLVYLALVVVLVAGVAAMAQRWLGRSQPLGALPYQKRKYFFSAAERSFYEVLRRSTGDELQLFAKVRLADLLTVPKGTQKRQSHWNRIQSKHVDFVLCDHKTLSPMLAIELDDASHQRSDRQHRDRFVEAACEAAGLPVLRVPAKQGYSPLELSRLIDEKLRPPVPPLGVADGQHPVVQVGD